MEPFIFVIFGATGDLAHRKLIPALYKLHSKNLLPKGFHCVAVARKDKSDEDYRKDASLSLEKFVKNFKKGDSGGFLDKISYFRNDFDISPSYTELKNYLEEIDKAKGTQGNRIFYLATLPEHFQPIVSNLEKHGLASKGKGFRRLIIEKPFGNDLASARELNRIITEVFHEKEIYRIDHYLGKETVQNLFALRVSNTIFEPVWNSEHIDNIQITVAESLGVEGRGNYYDKSGAIRDMVQNHILQILSLTAMDMPKEFSVSSIKNQKVNLLKAIEVKKTITGQYSGYLDEPGVLGKSRTETYAAMELSINNRRWKGMPVYVRTGKEMKQKSSEIAVYFKKTKGITGFPDYKQNVLVIRLQPEEGIYLRFNIKEPGNEFRIQRVSMDFCHECIFGINTPEAYEKLLYDAFNNDSNLFTRWDEVENAWMIINPLLGKLPRPLPYDKGSWGPADACDMLKKNGHHWRLRDE